MLSYFFILRTLTLKQNLYSQVWNVYNRMRHQVREGVMTSFIREKGLLFSFFLWFEDGQVCFYHMLFSLTSSTLIQVYDVSLVVSREDLISSRKTVLNHQTWQTM